MSAKSIRWDLPIETTDGRKAELKHKLYAPETMFVYVVLVINRDGFEFISQHNECGVSGINCLWSIHNIPPAPKVIFVNEYENTDAAWRTRDGAISGAEQSTVIRRAVRYVEQPEGEV